MTRDQYLKTKSALSQLCREQAFETCVFLGVVDGVDPRVPVERRSVAVASGSAGTREKNHSRLSGKHVNISKVPLVGGLETARLHAPLAGSLCLLSSAFNSLENFEATVP